MRCPFKVQYRRWRAEKKIVQAAFSFIKSWLGQERYDQHMSIVNLFHACKEHPDWISPLSR